MGCSFADGTPIPLKELSHVRDAIWENMVIQQWQKDDMMYLLILKSLLYLYKF